MENTPQNTTEAEALSFLKETQEAFYKLKVSLAQLEVKPFELSPTGVGLQISEEAKVLRIVRHLHGDPFSMKTVELINSLPEMMVVWTNMPESKERVEEAAKARLDELGLMAVRDAHTPLEVCAAWIHTRAGSPANEAAILKTQQLMDATLTAA